MQDFELVISGEEAQEKEQKTEEEEEEEVDYEE